MGKFLYLMTFLASLNPQYQNAGDNSRRALLETQMMKDELVQLETEADKHLYNVTGLHKEDLVYAAYAYPLVAGKISTKPFKNFKYDTEAKWTIRPEIEYGIWDRQTTLFLGVVKEF